jgi:hypothetical protein
MRAQRGAEQGQGVRQQGALDEESRARSRIGETASSREQGAEGSYASSRRVRRGDAEERASSRSNEDSHPPRAHRCAAGGKSKMKLSIVAAVPQRFQLDLYDACLTKATSPSLAAALKALVPGSLLRTRARSA